MRKDGLKGLVGDRRSVWFDVERFRNDPSLNQKSHRHYSPQTSMLIDDITLGTFPVPGFGPKKYTVKLEASDESCRELLINAMEGQYSRHDLTEVIYDFSQTCVQCIAAYGYAPYEIVYFSDNGGAEKAFLLTLIIPASFISKRGGFKQYVPPEEAVEQGLATSQIDLPSENILLFELPAKVKVKYEFMMESLTYFGGNLIPEWAMQNFIKPSVPFSQEDYLGSRELAIAHATREVGWNARDYGTNHELEFYVWYRQLRFYRFRCLIRNLVIETLNEGLRRVGNRLGFEASLSIEGLPTESDADVAMQRLLDGDLKTFHEVLEPF